MPGIHVDVAEPVEELLVPVLARIGLADDAHGGFTILFQEDHGRHEVRVERQDKVIGEQVVQVVREVVHNEDVARLVGEVLFPADDVLCALEQSGERFAAPAPELLRAHRLRGARHQLIDALELLEDPHLFPDVVQEVGYLGGQLSLYLVAVCLQHSQGAVSVI